MARSPARKIIHVDMDAFFASVEQRDDPALRGKPVAVGGSSARGVVAAASYEARKFGVRSAMPSITARRKCPDLVFVRSRFEVYRAVSRQIHAIFADYTTLIQPLSLDEAFLDVTENSRGIASAAAIATEIRARIRDETGLTASAGISYNKFLAKLASDHNKPDGQFVVTPAIGARWVESLPVERFHGIGPRTAARMHRLGIRTGADLRACSRVFLTRHFGSAAEWYWGIARGIDDRPVNPHRVRKSSGSETTFRENSDDPAVVETEALAMAADVWAWCTAAGRYGRTVTLKVKYADFQLITRAQSFRAPIDSRAALEDAALALLRRLYPLPKPVRLVGVSVSGFSAAPPDDAASDLPLFAL